MAKGRGSTMGSTQQSQAKDRSVPSDGIYFSHDATWTEQADKSSGIRVFHSVGETSLVEASVRSKLPHYDMVLITNGNRFGFIGEIDGQPFTVGPHSGKRITLVPAGMLLCGTFRVEPAPSTMILFPKGRLQGMLPRAADPIRPLAMVIDDTLADIFGTMETLVLGKSLDSQRRLEGLTRDVADQLQARALHDQGGNGSLALSPFNLRRVMAFIDENLARALTVDELAAHIGLSTFHFLRVFKQATGRTPHRHIVLRRLATAQMKIASTDLRIAEIAAQCGFASPAHLATSFRRHFGVSPMQYGANVRAGLTNAPGLDFFS